jgi:DNA-binding LacI/PurR family transcriptional regulator
MKKRAITRKDVAERAGVSTSVVSYVINNGPRPVSPETRARVEKAIEELGYYPNELARSLRLKQSSTIGLIIPNLNNHVYAEIAINMESICRAEGYLVLLCNSGRDVEQEQKFVQMLRSKQVDGVVMIPSQDPLELIQPLQNAHIPTVILEHDLPAQHCIVVDDLNGGRIGTRHLIELGHRRIAMIDRTHHSQTSALRAIGYRQTLAEARIAFDPNLIVKSEAGYEAACQAMRQLLTLENPPTAVFTHNDVQGLGALHAIQSAGLSVPDDISVIGYDDTASSAFLSPPLTTVRFPKKEMGQQAAKMIMQLAKSQETLPAQIIVLPVELVVRGSTASPP